MNNLNLDDVNNYVGQKIGKYYDQLIVAIKQVKFSDLLFINPYLLKTNDEWMAGKLIEDLLETYLSSSEEKLFGDFLEDLAIFVAGKTCGGYKIRCSRG